MKPCFYMGAWAGLDTISMELMLGPVGKFNEPKVRLAISGLPDPVI